MKTSAPLRGMRHHPPALEIYPNLGYGQELILQRDPMNPYDENAIKVLLPAEWFEAHPELSLEITEPLMLGHVAAEVAAEWAPIFDAFDECPRASLSFSASGLPIVTLEKSDE